MSSIVLSGDTSGTVTVAVPAVAGTNTVTIAAQTGTLNAAGPAFSVYPSSNQSIPNGAFTKIALQNEVFDTNNCFDNATNYRFTPNVAGYYQFNASVFANAGADRPQLVIYKNGSAAYTSTQVSSSLGGGTTLTLSVLIQANGTTDYFELYYYQGSGGSVTVNGTSTITYFQGSLVRGA